MLEDRIEREDSVETFASFNTEDSCSTVSQKSSSNDLEPFEHAIRQENTQQFPFVSAHAHTLRAYSVQAAHSDAITSRTSSCITLTLRLDLSPPPTFLQTTRDGSSNPSSGPLPFAYHNGVVKLVFPFLEEGSLTPDQRIAVILVVNRDLISKCALLLHKQWKPGDPNEDANTAAKESLYGVKPVDTAYLPREGMHLVLYFTQGKMLNHPNINTSSNPTAWHYLCRSFDVVSFTTNSDAAFCGIPLKPYHRYHLRYNSKKGIELNLNRYSFLQLRLNSEDNLNENENSPIHIKPNIALKKIKKGSKRPRKSHLPGGFPRPSVCATAKTNSSAAIRDGGRAHHRPGRKSVTAQLDRPFHSTEYSSSDSFPSFPLDSSENNETESLTMVPVAAPLSRRKSVLFTTGMRLSRVQERLCTKLGFIVNPSLSKACEASILVVHGPLMRSIKLLTVLPYIKALVDRKWLDDMLSQGNPFLPIEPYVYAENKRVGGIEHTNEFSMESTLNIPLEQRQRLFASHTFWIHPSVAPQDPPMNDLHTVLTASGGRISESITDASTWVLPSLTPSVVSMKIITKALKDEEISNRRRHVRNRAAFENDIPLSRLLSSVLYMVVPDDIFRSVLQQLDLCKFTLRIGNVISMLSTTNTKKRIRSPKQKSSTKVVKVSQV
ncbi:unnamed protein product [Phytomonas sp. Hart1]|nr:unnamed protein product [Phytomonas sp. Hart1]|eukprot:CCW71169.1 unnamed protein product [Phytomonas sp. isolate Hart1]